MNIARTRVRLKRVNEYNLRSSYIYGVPFGGVLMTDVDEYPGGRYVCLEFEGTRLVEAWITDEAIRTASSSPQRFIASQVLKALAAERPYLT